MQCTFDTAAEQLQRFEPVQVPVHILSALVVDLRCLHLPGGAALMERGEEEQGGWSGSADVFAEPTSYLKCCQQYELNM